MVGQGRQLRAAGLRRDRQLGRGQEVETSLNGAPRTGYVRLGDDPAFIFDMPHRQMALQTRGPDGLAVMPPQDGPVSLGGVRIEGDGRVFVRC